MNVYLFLNLFDNRGKRSPSRPSSPPKLTLYTLTPTTKLTLNSLPLWPPPSSPPRPSKNHTESISPEQTRRQFGLSIHINHLFMIIMDKTPPPRRHSSISGNNNLSWQNSSGNNTNTSRQIC